MTISRNGLIWCAEDQRSGVLLAPTHPLNGIDFVEYRRAPAAPPGQRNVLEVTFLKNPPTAPALVAANFTVIGGVRIVDIKVLAIQPDPSDALRLRVFLDQEGDFSVYILRIEHPLIDEERSQARFSFKAGCPTEFDCRVQVECPHDVLPEPALDYLAKDYQSFRRLLVDLIADRNPRWKERLPADHWMTLVELLAYVGDYLSYFQDAGPGTESYFDTCLHRMSAARHARLIDYRMHNGRNAFTYVHFAAEAGTDGVVPAGAKLVTRIGRPLIGASAAPGTVIPTSADFDADPALLDATVFEVTALTRVVDRHNELRIHTWDDAACCLAAGAYEAFLFGISGAAGAETGFAPELKPGDYLLLEEVRSPVTGVEADRDPKRRHVVRIVTAETHFDRAFRAEMPGGKLTPRSSPADSVLPLQHVVWRAQDALPFTLCISAQTIEGQPIDPVSVARGNVTPADHGRTVKRDSTKGELPLLKGGSGRWPLPSLALPSAPLAHQPMPAEADYDAAGRLLAGRHDLAVDVREAVPAVVLLLQFPKSEREIWTPAPSLLNSGPFDQQFVAEIDNQGQALLRFGDDQYGRRPTGATGVLARFRIGNGRAGNIGAGSLVHIVTPDPADPLDPANPGAPLNFADVEHVYQPISARVGTDPETIEQARQLAPEAFRAVQFRAVTERDWDEVALRHPAVAAAKASFHWTGSWFTVFVAINPRDPSNLRRLPGGGAELVPAFAAMIKAFLTRFKLAGYDLRVHAATYVPLEIDITLCIARGHFRGDVLEAVTRALSNRAFPDGTRGFFHPLAFGFGEPVYLSRLYAALGRIDGLESATVTVFKRYWETASDEIKHGVIPMGPFEIARLDNSSNFPENGVLRLTAVGGL
jgi:hypothetical protein